MRKRCLKLISLCAMLCIVVLALPGAAKNPESVMVKDLLEKRMNVMENVLYGKITYDEGKIKLREIEEGELYKRDADNLASYHNTDIDKVEDMEIISLEKESEIYDIMTFEAKINWSYRGMDGSYDETDMYQIGLSQKGDECRLISFELLQN